MIILRNKKYSLATRVGGKAAGAILGAKKVANNVAWNLQLNPRGAIKEGAALVAENPITVTSQFAATPLHIMGAAPLGVVGQGVVAALPNSVPYVMGEAALKKQFPKYAKATAKAGKAIRTNKTVDAVLGNGPTAEEALQMVGPKKAPLLKRVGYNFRSGISDISNGIQNAGMAGVRILRGFSKTE